MSINPTDDDSIFVPVMAIKQQAITYTNVDQIYVTIWNFYATMSYDTVQQIHVHVVNALSRFHIIIMKCLSVL